jgi:ribosomal protein L37AE/L43A
MMAQSEEYYTCEHCDFGSNSSELYSLHMGSNEHARRMNVLATDHASAPEDFDVRSMARLRCDLCSVNCDTHEVMMIHLNSVKHAKKLVFHSRVESSQWKCDLCRIVMTGEESYNAHMKGKQHASTLKRAHSSL